MGQHDLMTRNEPESATTKASDRPVRRHILTVSVEEYFHHGAFSRAVQEKHWGRIEPRLERNLDEVLRLFAEHGVTATFFVHGSSVERHPGIVGRLMDGGHEIASRGYWPRGVGQMSPRELRDDLLRTRRALEAAGSHRVIGFRSPRWLREKDLWVLKVLAEEGYRYDSSINPILRRFARRPNLFRCGQVALGDPERAFWEIPVSTAGFLGTRLTIAGGNYIRQFPHWLLKRAVERWDRTREEPLVFYFMPWELDGEQPHIRAISRRESIMHYRNLAKTRWVLKEYFARFRFQSVARYLDIDTTMPRVAATRTAAAGRADAPVLRVPSRVAKPVSLVVPFFNEEQNIDYFVRTIEELCARLAEEYAIELVLVDDGSTDRTASRLQASFRDRADVRVISHERNQGVARAILTGIRAASTEIVCTMDCDCSYDPTELARMIPLADECDLVTASPYHPNGHVFNVPRWRLFLSRNLSRLYSLVLRERMYTYTSCFRVHRRSAVEGITIENGGFLGVAELLIRLRQRGARIVEYPTTLESRLFGESKMKVLYTILGHLRLFWRVCLRPGGAPGGKPVAADPGGPRNGGVQ